MVEERLPRSTWLCSFLYYTDNDALTRGNNGQLGNGQTFDLPNQHIAMLLTLNQ